MLLSRDLLHIAALAIKLQPMLTSQIGDKLLIRVRLRPAHLVIEMNDAEYDAEFLPQFDQQSQQRNGINTARDCDTDAIAGA
jgi:hypothetical protein